MTNESELVTDEFSEWAEKAIDADPESVEDVFKKYQIADEPTAETIMLGAVKHGKNFMQDMGDIYPVPSDVLSANGESVNSNVSSPSFFFKVMDELHGPGTASSLWGAKPGATQKALPPSSKETPDEGTEKKPEDSKDIKIFGTEIHKTYVFIAIGLLITGVAYYVWRRHH